jgi:hypothetical protein
MKRFSFTTLALCAFANLSAHSVQAQAASGVPYADCQQIAERLVTDLAKSVQTPEQASDSVRKDVAKHVTCLASVMPSMPSRSTNALKALAESLGNSMQQSSPAGASGSTSPVSKPTGSTSLIQDVGGFSTTSNGSALTLQFAPGDLVQQMGSAGAFDFCTATLQTKGCRSTWWLKAFAPATFSVTANTTTPGASVSGTAASAGSVVPATLNSLSNKLSFGGVTAKYGLPFLTKKTSDGKAQADPVADAASKEAAALSFLMNKLATCKAYTDWVESTQTNAIKAMQAAQADGNPTTLTHFIVSSYTDLVTHLSSDPTCKDSLSAAVSSIRTVSAFQTAIVAQQALATSSTPMLGLEYDFTTPPNKPSYHSAKLNFTWQSTVSCTTQVQAAETRASSSGTPSSTMLSPSAGTCTSAKSGSQPINPMSTSANPGSKSASATPNWTVSASAGADIYNDEPSSAISSASHLRDIQAGAEITRVWHISTYKQQNASLAALFSKLGDLSLVGAYYYQDQTSPSILNGPPSSITFNGLPTTASQVFATRGPINVGQIRLGFGTGTNFRFPIAVSYSNRSDLIVHPFVGVQFGVSYDLFGK